MGAYIFKQPNGLYGRFSSVVSCPTDYNMTENDLIERAMLSIAKDISHEVKCGWHIKRTFDDVLEDTQHGEGWVMTDKSYERFIKKTSEIKPKPWSPAHKYDPVDPKIAFDILLHSLGVTDLDADYMEVPGYTKPIKRGSKEHMKRCMLRSLREVKHYIDMMDEVGGEDNE